MCRPSSAPVNSAAATTYSVGLSIHCPGWDPAVANPRAAQQDWRTVDGVDVTEVIIATDPNTEGEATATYLVRMLRDIPGLTVTRIASGLPMGGDLEFADELTLGRALTGRRAMA